MLERKMRCPKRLDFYKVFVVKSLTLIKQAIFINELARRTQFRQDAGQNDHMKEAAEDALHGAY